jgi:hypothetical protein
MTINEFNSKIHLPKLAAKLGLGVGCEYVKMPVFGWLGYNRARTNVFDLFDLMVINDANIEQIYKYFTIEHTEYLDSHLYYSEYEENRLFQSWLRDQRAVKFWLMSVEEAKNEPVMIKGRKIKLNELAEELGLANFHGANIGLINHRLLGISQFLPMKEEGAVAGRLLVPSFYAPGHLASLEMLDLDDLCSHNPLIPAARTIYLRGERGWYGELNKAVVGSFKTILTAPGCTWDKKIDHWTTEPLDLHESLNTAQCLEIWSKSKNLTFKQSPLLLVKENNKLDRARDCISTLNLAQVLELEQVLGEPLKARWFESKSSQIEIGDVQYLCKDGRYYYMSSGRQVEATNFSVTLDGIKKEDDEWFQYGYVYFNGTETRFRVNRCVFNSPEAFANAIREIMLDAGVGVPIIILAVKSQLPQIVDVFNQNNPIDNTTPAQAAVTPALPPKPGSVPGTASSAAPRLQTPSSADPDLERLLVGSPAPQSPT